MSLFQKSVLKKYLKSFNASEIDLAWENDAAILSSDGDEIAVIELKDTTTTDLGEVEKQALGYNHQHKNGRHIIT